MKKAIIIFALLFFVQPQLYAQVKTTFGDDVSTLDGIMKAYYDVVTVKKGERVNYKRDSCLHVPNAMVGMSKKENGKVTLKLITLKQFHEASDAFLEKDGFYEKEIGRKVENFGSVYHVWSTYFNTYSSKEDGRGINSIELYFDGSGFWILSWVFDEESKENPIPEMYLKN